MSPARLFLLEHPAPQLGNELEDPLFPQLVRRIIQETAVDPRSEALQVTVTNCLSWELFVASLHPKGDTLQLLRSWADAYQINELHEFSACRLLF
jgi:hypothetical protein